MTDAPHSLILEPLRAIRGSARAHGTRHRGPEKFRTGQVEQTLAQHGTTLAHFSSRFDRVDERLERIEKRLRLVDAGIRPARARDPPPPIAGLSKNNTTQRRPAAARVAVAAPDEAPGRRATPVKAQ